MNVNYLKIFVLGITFLISANLFCQTIENTSLIRINSSPHYKNAFGADKFGNTYTAISAGGQLFFEGGASTNNVPFKLFKHNVQGDLEWSYSPQTQAAGIYDIQVNSQNEIFIAGQQQYGLFPDSVNPNGMYNYTYFIAKMLPDGTFSTITRFPGLPAMYVQPNGNVAFALQASTSLNSTQYIGNTPVSLENYNLVYGEMSSLGAILWYEVDQNTYSVPNGKKLVRDCAGGNGKFYFAGEFNLTSNVGGTQLNMGNSQNNNSYVAELDLTTHQVTHAAMATNVKFTDMQVDSQGNLYLAAQHEYLSVAPTFMGNTLPTLPGGSADAYIYKVNAGFSFGGLLNISSSPAQGNMYLYANALAIKDDDIYICGGIQGNAGTGTYNFGSSQNYSGSRIFLLRYKSDLTFRNELVFESFPFFSGLPDIQQLSKSDDNVFMFNSAKSPLAADAGFDHNAFVSRHKTKLNFITGRAFKDFNMDGIFNANDQPLSGSVISASPGSLTSVTDADGFFNVVTNSGQYQLQIADPHPYYTLSPASASVNFTGFNQTQNVSLRMNPVPGAHDLRLDFYQLNQAVVGADHKQKLLITNDGTFAESGTVHISPLEYSLPFGTAVATTPATYVDGNYLAYDFSDLQPGDTLSIVVTYADIPVSFLSILGESSLTSAEVEISNPDLLPLNNTAGLSVVLVAAYDPNIKQVNRQREIFTSELPEVNDFSYTIHFQNEGNAPATNVYIEDDLSEFLSVSSLQIIDYSDDVKVKIEGRKVRFFFDNIMLPPKMADEEGSKGYVHFRVKRTSAFGLHDTIPNFAGIFFDYNPAIITETVINTVVSPPNTAPVASADVAATNFNTAVDIDIFLNDEDDASLSSVSIDLDVSTLGIQTSFNATQGVWLVSPPGIVTFTPTLGYSGLAEIDYVLVDEEDAVSNSAAITVTVAENAPPQAVDDISDMSGLTTVTIDILSNDNDIDGFIDAETADLDSDLPGIQTSVDVDGEGLWEYGLSGLTFTPAPEFDGLATRQYTVKDDYGLISNPGSVTISGDSFLSLNEEDKIVEIFPNPASDKLNISITGTHLPVTIKIYDLNAKLVHSGSLTEQLDITELRDGVYYITLTSDQEIFSRKKLIVSHK